MKNELVKVDETATSKVKENSQFDKEEEKILKKNNHKLLKGFAVAAALVMTYIIASCILDIYKFFYDIHPYAGYGALAVCLLLLIIFVIRPVAVALSTPCFTLDVVDQVSARKASRINHRKLVKVAKNLLKYNKNLSEDSKEKIRQSLGNKRQLNETLKAVYKNEISKEINQIINANAVTVMAGTAISQNSKLDSAIVIITNIRMIMKIVVKCGYHPSYAQLSKLILKVFRNAMIAYTIQSLNVGDLITAGLQKLVSGVGQITGLSKIIDSVTQGAANALLTLRIGIITRKYLYKEFDLQAQIDENYSIDEQIVVDAVNEANGDIDDVLEQYKKNKKTKTA